MSEIDRNIAHVSHDLLLARLGLRPSEIPNLIARLAELKREYWKQWEAGLDADEKFYEAHQPKAKPPTCLVPMSPDDYLDSMGRVRRQNCEERPDR